MPVFNTEFPCHIDVKKFAEHKDEVNCVAFSTDFEILVTGSDDQRTRVFNTQTGQMVVRLKGQEGAIRCVAISNNSKLIASGSYDKSVIIYRTMDAETLHILKGHLKSVESVTFSPCNKKLVSTSWDRTGILWSVESGDMLRVFQGHSGLVQCAAFSHCKRMLATGSWDHTVRIWPLHRKAGDNLHELTAHKSNIHSVAFSMHNILATGSWDKQVILWNPYKAEIIYTLTGHTGWVQALCFSYDGYLVASSADDGTVKVWSVADGSCIRTLEGHTESGFHCGFHPTGALIVAGSAILDLYPTKDEKEISVPTNGSAPHILDGEEILDETLERIRAQSAHVSRRKPTSKLEGRPSTGQEDRKQTSGNVERWVSSSFQSI